MLFGILVMFAIMTNGVFKGAFLDNGKVTYSDFTNKININKDVLIDHSQEQHLIYFQRKDGAYEEDGNNGSKQISFSFYAFGEHVILNPFQNDYLVSNHIDILIHNYNGSITNISDTFVRNTSESCHFIGKEDNFVAAMTHCQETDSNAVDGIVIRHNEVLELKHIPRRIKRDDSERNVYVFKRPYDRKWTFQNRGERYRMHKLGRNGVSLKPYFVYVPKPIYPRTRNEPQRNNVVRTSKTLELGVFMDDESYRLFAPVYNYKDSKIVDLLLGIVNQMQAIFYQDFLEEKIILTVVHLEIFKIMPAELKFDSTDAYKVLSKFCDYQQKINPDTDKNPNHWDMALLFTGKDLQTVTNGQKSTSTMGMSVINGVCNSQHSCVIVEFGTMSHFGKPFLTAGLLSAYIMAHEMGHNLGMIHDGFGNDCPKNGFLMSASRGTHGETIWSDCSTRVLKQLNATCLEDSAFPQPNWDHMKFKLVPGQVWDADEQCQLFLKDHQAKQATEPLKNICESVRCITPRRSGHYFIGPALDGTFCDSGKWCKKGECVPWDMQPKIVKGNWGKWSIQPCSSGCVVHSRGIVRSFRQCNNPKPINIEPCEGKDIKLQFCDDSKICKKRTTAREFANTKCAEFSKYLPFLTSVGDQMWYNKMKTWQPCAVFCQRRTEDSWVWYSPKDDLNDLSMDTFFPDGTWCHSDNTQNYYCIQRSCVPETSIHNFKLLQF